MDEWNEMVLSRLDRIETVVVQLAKLEERQIHEAQDLRQLRSEMDGMQDRIQTVDMAVAVIRETTQSTHMAAWLILGTLLSVALSWVAGLI